jgi:hypothetical protein
VIFFHVAADAEYLGTLQMILIPSQARRSNRSWAFSGVSSTKGQAVSIDLADTTIALLDTLYVIYLRSCKSSGE